jgi:hypothetical protein
LFNPALLLLNRSMQKILSLVVSMGLVEFEAASVFWLEDRT